ncbi:MAG TPA: hypothetical protein VJ456_08515, partial [Acidimicrobiia bacterium]|nr:hypothetical protein [Acidimicrobiia bacterium]
MGPRPHAAEDGQELQRPPHEAEEGSPQQEPAVLLLHEDGDDDHHRFQAGGQGQDHQGHADVADGGQVEEEDVGQRAAQRKEHLGQQCPGQADEPDPAVGRIQQVAGVLGHDLDRAVRPAAPLAHHRRHPLRRFGPGHRGGLVGDAPPGRQQREREVGVLH